MLNRGWCGKLLCGMLVVMAARVATAQDAPSRGTEGPEAPTGDPGEGEGSEGCVEGRNDFAHGSGGGQVVRQGEGRRRRARGLHRETDAAPNGRDRSSDFALQSGRLYTGGKITEFLSATLNAEFTLEHRRGAGRHRAAQGLGRVQHLHRAECSRRPIGRTRTGRTT